MYHNKAEEQKICGFLTSLVWRSITVHSWIKGVKLSFLLWCDGHFSKSVCILHVILAAKIWIIHHALSIILKAFPYYLKFLSLKLKGPSVRIQSDYNAYKMWGDRMLYFRSSILTYAYLLHISMKSKY